MRALWLTFRETAKLIGAHRKLWIPFLVVVFIELVLLGLLWLAPHPPFSKFLAPPVRYFFGGQVLHYPWHLWFLYQAMKHTRLIALTLVGAFFTGIACVMVRQTHEGSPLSLRNALVGRQVRYGVVLLLWVITVGLVKGMIGLLDQVVPKAPWALWVLIGSTIILQTLLIYAIPAAVFTGSTWWRALVQSIREALRYPVSTFLIVAMSSLVVILFALAAPPARVAHWTARTTPEITLVFVAARLIVWTVADVLVTVSLAHLWWLHRTPRISQVSASVPAARRVAFGHAVEEDPVTA